MPLTPALPILPIIFALFAFAANSLFCRLALAQGDIDANSFTVIRLISGSVILLLLPLKNQPIQQVFCYGSWRAALALFVYAACFSLAYVQLDAASGALILFASVQFGLIGWSILTGKSLVKNEWFGLCLACIGFGILVFPYADLQSQTSQSLLMMIFAGLAWSAYTLFGKGSQAPLADTRANFVRTLPMALLLFGIAYLFPNLFASTSLQVSTHGVLWAVASGMLASGLGYAVWYSALPQIIATQAAVLQLLVPIIAAFGGVLWLGESLTLTLLASSLMIIGGIYWVLKADSR